MGDVDPMFEFAFVRLRAPSEVFNAAAGDTVRVTRDIAELLVGTGAADSVPAQLCEGLRYRPDSCAVD